MPGGVYRFIGEIGVLAGDALAPGGKSVSFEFDKQNAATRGDAKAGLERVGEGEIDLAKVDGVDLEGRHRVLFWFGVDYWRFSRCGGDLSLFHRN